MPIVFVPPEIRRRHESPARIRIEATTMRGVIDELDLAVPGMREWLLDPADNDIRAEIAVVIDGTVSPRRLLAKPGPNAEIHFLPAISGG